MFGVAGKKILITGASSGIGRQIAIDVAKNGGIVSLLGRDKGRLAEVANELEGVGHNYFSLDLTNSQQLGQFIEQSGNFDGVVFNAGIIDYTPVKFITEEKIDAIFDINYKSVVLLSQRLIKNKRVNKSGSLVFISSISSKLGVPGTAIYASSKAALSSYTKIIASELSAQKIRANCISPGIVITPMTQQASNAGSDEGFKNAEKLYPLGYGTPEDVSGLCFYLLSDVSRWMTGSDLVLDGGHTLI